MGMLWCIFYPGCHVTQWVPSLAAGGEGASLSLRWTADNKDNISLVYIKVQCSLDNVFPMTKHFWFQTKMYTPIF